MIVNSLLRSQLQMLPFPSTAVRIVSTYRNEKRSLPLGRRPVHVFCEIWSAVKAVGISIEKSLRAYRSGSWLSGIV